MAKATTKALETASLHKQESFGRYGAFQLEITVRATKLPPLESEAICHAVYHAAKAIEAAVLGEVVRNDPETKKDAANEKIALLAVFPGPIFVEEIPNGYCSDYCCKHRPWFVVTTRVGRIKIGWRKRVIQIDWSETVNTKNSHELFQAENVTKDDHMIHAWSYEDAARYVAAIIASEVTNSPK